jgi:uncharacterized protein (DUF934 family)
MPLIKDGRRVDDLWVAVADDAPLPAGRPVIVSLKRWQAEHDLLVERDAPVGVRLKSNELAETIAADAGRLGLIALEFPGFRDGRAYSTARLLRERHRFRGELRAVGQVLRDQFLFMQRCGFDAFEVSDAQADAWPAAIAEFSVFYQPTGDGRPTAIHLRQQKHSKRAAE